MKRTQIQLPDWLFAAARDVAEKKEVSLAELVRRGLEYMVAVTPHTEASGRTWELPPSRPLGSSDPFIDSGWREQLHTGRLRVAEEGVPYDPGEGP